MCRRAPLRTSCTLHTPMTPAGSCGSCGGVPFESASRVKTVALAARPRACIWPRCGIGLRRTRSGGRASRAWTGSDGIRNGGV
eukprot:3071929-Prymnesium_polylepis.1